MATSAASGRWIGCRRNWARFLPLFALIVVSGEIWFLGWLDLAKNAAMLQSWSSYHTLLSPVSPYHWSELTMDDEDCRKWLEKVDSVEYKRDFRVEPVLVDDSKQVVLFSSLIEIIFLLSDVR